MCVCVCVCVCVRVRGVCVCVCVYVCFMNMCVVPVFRSTAVHSATQVEAVH